MDMGAEREGTCNANSLLKLKLVFLTLLSITVGLPQAQGRMGTIETASRKDKRMHATIEVPESGVVWKPSVSSRSAHAVQCF